MEQSPSPAILDVAAASEHPLIGEVSVEKTGRCLVGNLPIGDLPGWMGRVDPPAWRAHVVSYWSFEP
jgi:hypothetical protein